MKKMKKVRKIKQKIKILKEVIRKEKSDVAKEVDELVDDLPAVSSSVGNFSSGISGFSGGFVPTGRVSVSPVRLNEEELEHQSRNFYTSGLAARDERRNYIAGAPRVTIPSQERTFVNQVPDVFDASRNLLGTQDRTNVFGDNGEIKYYDASVEQKKRRIDQ